MQLKQIKLQIARGESNTLEFKTSTATLKAACETICAFLNGKGGTVLIGIKNNGEIIGQNVTDNTRLEITHEIKKIEPTASIEIHYIKLENNKFIIAIQTQAGNHAPYIYDGRAFQRSESETSRMSQHRYEQLLVQRGQLNHSWEEAIANEYKLSDLDQEEIYKTIADGIRENRVPASAQRETTLQMLDRLGLIIKGKLNRAAIVLYAKQEALKLVQCMLKMARFKGTNNLGDFIDNQQIYSSYLKLRCFDRWLTRD